MLAACVACLLGPQAAHGQSVTAEAAAVTGVSTDDVSAGGVQLRAFGELPGAVRFFGEAAWARASAGDNDAFATAYPYDNRVQIIEAYAERIFQPGKAIAAIRAGRFRTPFGISSASEQGYTGFLRPPLIRYAAYASLSNDYLEQGADVVVGVPRLTFEIGLGAPGDAGPMPRGSGLDTTLRVQGSAGPFIAGVSYLRNHSYESPADPSFRASATGLDIRWMQDGVQVRGEWIIGRPVDDATNNGWYVDASIHRVGMGAVTAVARLERLAVVDAGEAEDSLRQTVGARVRLPRNFSLTVNLVHRSGVGSQEYPAGSLDVGLGWSVRFRR